MTHYIFGIAKCTTILLGISLEGFTHKNDHADTSECPSWRVGHSISEALPDTECDLWTGGMNLSWVNARLICKNDGCGHCDVWTKEEAYLAAQPLVIFCYVCAQLDIPVFLPNFGGTAAALIFVDAFMAELTGYDEYVYFQNEISSLISIERTGTHLSNFDLRRYQTWPKIEDQIDYVDKSVLQTNYSLQQFFRVIVLPSCARRGIIPPITPNLHEHLRSDNKGALLVQCPSDANKDWLYELVRRRQSELARRGHAGAISALVEQGVPSKEAASELARRGYAGAISALVKQGIPLEEAAAEKGRRCYAGAIAALVKQGVPSEEAVLERGRRGHAGAIAALVKQGVPLEEATSERGRRGHAGAISALVAQGFSVKDAKVEFARRATKNCHGKGGENDIESHGYYLVQEINKLGIPCNHKTDRKAETMKDIAMWLSSDNVRIGYSAWTLLNKLKEEEDDKIINHRNESDKRRWRVSRGHNIPHGIKSVNESEITKEMLKLKRKSAIKD